MARERRPVRQEDPLGCGIACVAYVTGISYDTAKARYFKNKRSAATSGYLCRDIVAALSLAGGEHAYNYVKGRKRFAHGTIVFIKRSARYPSGHYLVKSVSGWMDPWINFNAKNPEVNGSKAGFRRRLPGKPIYFISRKQAVQ